MSRISTLSRSRRRSPAAYLAATLFVAFATLFAAVSAEAGLYFEAVTTVDQGAGSSTVRAWIDGDNAHIEFTDSDVPQVGKGNYLLTTDGGETFFLVNPAEKSYMRWDMSQVMNMLDGMKGLVSIEITNTEIDKLEEKAGGEVLGHDTRYVRFQSSFDTKIKVMGMKRSSSTETLQEVWVTDDYDVAAMSAWFKGLRSTGAKEMDDLFQKSMDAVDGFALKSVAVSTTVDRKGRETRSRTVTEVTEVREESIDAAQFDMPAGYQETQLVPEGEDGGNPLKGIFGRGKN